MVNSSPSEQGATKTPAHAASEGTVPKFLEAGQVLLHIGPRKTGTTSLQQSLATARASLHDQGVLYPGDEREHHYALFALREYRAADRKRQRTRAKRHLERWTAFCAEVTGRQDRCVISGEHFDQSGADEIAAIVDGIGPPVRVLITVRPLEKMLPSLWQQYVRNGLDQSWPEWVESVLEDRQHRVWDSYQLDALAQRWMSVLGPGNVAILPLRNPGQLLLRDVEDCVGISPGTLSPISTNPSLDYPSSELIRQFNKTNGIHMGLNDLPGSDPVATRYRRLVRREMFSKLVDTDPRSGSKIPVPEPVLSQIRSHEREMFVALRHLDVTLLSPLPQTPELGEMKDTIDLRDEPVRPREFDTLPQTTTIPTAVEVASQILRNAELTLDHAEDALSECHEELARKQVRIDDLEQQVAHANPH